MRRSVVAGINGKSGDETCVFVRRTKLALRRSRSLHFGLGKILERSWLKKQGWDGRNEATVFCMKAKSKKEKGGTTSGGGLGEE